MDARTRILALGALIVLSMVARPALAQARLFAPLHQMLPTDGDTTVALALGDLDGDGDLDALVGNAYALQNRLYRNDGLGVLTVAPPSDLPIETGSTSAFALGDVDGDGDLDVLVGISGQQNRLYVNTGSGTFIESTATNLPADSDETQALAMGDLDGDGDLDAIIGNFAYPGGQQNRLYLNDGAGVFTDATLPNLPADTEATMALALGDVDSDGDLDVIVGNVGSQNRLYLNDGSGSFGDATASNPHVGSGFTLALGVGDVDGDGDLDLLRGNAGQNSLHLNDGFGFFTEATATHLPLDSVETSAVTLGDVDDDGDLDVVLGNDGQDRIYVNDGAGVFTDATAARFPSSSGYTTALAVGDLDGDGDLDALFGNWDSANRLYLNDGAGSFTDVGAANLPVDSDDTMVVVLGDVDGDEDLDAVIGNFALSTGQQNRLYLNQGWGVFTDVTSTNFPVDSDMSRALALGDLDADGDLDVLIGNSGQDRLYVNDGLGMFADGTIAALPVDTTSTGALALGDVDSDGDLDVLAGKGGPNRLYLNDGSGVFIDVSATSLPLASDGTTTVALGDVDGDGDLDALIGNTGSPFGQQNRLYTNDGFGLFSDATVASLPAISDGTAAAALGDIDGDGDLDAWIGNCYHSASGRQNRLFMNDGFGTFSDVTATHLPVDADATFSLALGDVDGDGDLDALLGNGFNGADGSGTQIRLYLNDGSAGFTDGTSAHLPVDHDDTRAVALGDVDGDGDLDAFIGSWGWQNRLYSNLTRQLAWRGIPRFAKALTLDLRGPPGDPWILGAATGTADIPSPAWGTLRLEPASLIVVDQGVFDSQGRSSLTYDIGPNPGGTPGLTLYGQALVGSPAWLSNLEVIAFTDL